MSQPADVETFLRRYGEAQAESAEAAASHWSLPGMLIDLYDDPMVFTDRADLVEALAPAYPIYRRLGLPSIRLAQAEISEVTQTVVRARTRWSFYAGDDLLTDPIFDYTLRRQAGEVGVCFAVAVDLAEKIDGIAQRKNIAL